MIDKIEEIRAKAAKFYRVDLHVHSPRSHDWKNEQRGNYIPLEPLNKLDIVKDIPEESLDAYLSELEKSKLNLVAITDHMKYSFGIALSDYAKKSNKKLAILPGIELNVKLDQPLVSNLRIHILAVFPPDIGQKIERIFPPSSGDEKSFTGNEDIPVDNLNTIIESIHDIGGIAIAAHIYSGNGMRYAYTKSAELILNPLDTEEKDNLYKNVGDEVKKVLYKFNCLQVKDTNKPVHVHFKGDSGELVLPLIICTDSHHVTSFGDENNITYIKMGKPDYICLCEAFKFPDTRIRFKSNLPQIKPPRVRGVRIVGETNNEKTFFKDTTIGFSDNLTCIIGPRGSGKSALIDAIRYAMGYNRTLDEIAKVEKQVKDRQTHTLQKSKIQILYEKSDGVIHTIESVYDSKENYTTKVYDTNNNALNIMDVEVCGEYPLNLYGWSELELLGEEPKSQRENLDKFIPELKPLKPDKDKLYQELNINTKNCISQIDILDKYFEQKQPQSIFIRIKEFENEFNRLNTPEIDSKFRELDEINQKINFLSAIKKKVVSLAQKISELTEINYDELLKKFANISEWCNGFITDKIILNSINKEIVNSKDTIELKLKGLINIVESEETKLITTKNDIEKSIREAVGENEAITAELRNQAKKRLDDAREHFDLYKQGLNSLNNLLGQRKTIIGNIKDINKNISEIRQQKTSGIIEKITIVNDDNYKIDLKLNPSKDRTDFLSELEKNTIRLEYQGHYKEKKIPLLLVDKLNPLSFVEIILSKSFTELQNTKTMQAENISQTYSIDEEYSKKFIDINYPIELLPDLEVERYYKEKISRLFTIQEIPFDDEFYIELNGKPIQYCSPGQRCSAMLPIVTLTAEAPIIIDQPEDNLDNRMVSKAIFKILSKLKETRQIVVATHNPNILVSGDAEQVIVLGHDGKVANYGSIDEPTIIKDVIDLMEGGKEAFEKREKKYKPIYEAIE